MSNSLNQIRVDVLSVLIWVQTVCKGYQQTGIFLQFLKGALEPFRLGMVVGKHLNWEICYSAKLCDFWSIQKLAITHTFAIKLKENFTV